MKRRIHFDTDVLLDVLLKRMPFATAAAQTWDLAERAVITGCVSAISFNNVYYVVRRIKTRKAADRAICLIRDIFECADLTGQILNQATDAKMADFEDAIQIFSAIHAGADTILTRNTSYYRQAAIPAVTPAEFITAFEGS